MVTGSEPSADGPCGIRSQLDGKVALLGGAVTSRRVLDVERDVRRLDFSSSARGDRSRSADLARGWSTGSCPEDAEAPVKCGGGHDGWCLLSSSDVVVYSHVLLSEVTPEEGSTSGMPIGSVEVVFASEDVGVLVIAAKGLSATADNLRRGSNCLLCVYVVCSPVGN